MGQKLGPIILIVALILILIFIVGVKYGQRVEKVNKTISYLISIAPTKPVPTTAPIEFKEYINDSCGFKFLYPAQLEVQKIGSSSGYLAEAKQGEGSAIMNFACPDSKNFNRLAVQFHISDHVATKEATFQNQKITLLLVGKEDAGTYYLSLIHPFTKREILFIVKAKFYPLLEKSLTFIKPTIPTLPPLQKTITP